MKSVDDATDRRTTVVPKNVGSGAFGTELLLLPSGRLLCTYSRADFERDIRHKVMIVSDDRGRTWGKPRILRQAAKSGGPMTRGESLTRLRDGRIAVGCNRVWDDSGGGFYLRWSHDDGATWGDPGPVADKGSFGWNNHLVETPDGGLLLTVVHDFFEEEPLNKYVWQHRSVDGGKTWRPREIISHVPNLNLTEPSTIRLRDGRLMSVLRENSYNSYPSYKIFSEDNGQTWSTPQEMPIFGHECYLGQLQSGRIMIAYRHVGGYAGTLAWAGDPDETAGYQVCGTLRSQTPPEVANGVLSIRTAGKGETVLYHLHPPECEESTIELEAKLRCPVNVRNACGIHMAQAGWLAFYLDRVELPDCGGLTAPVDGTAFHCYRVVRDENELIVFADGRPLLRTTELQRGQILHNRGGYIRCDNVNVFGTQSPFMGDLDAEAEGRAEWRSIRLSIRNPSHPDHEYEWHASSGKLPNAYEEERMIEIENNYGGSVYFVGQVAWVQFPDGEIFLVTGKQYYEPNGRRNSWMRGCYLHEEELLS